MLVKTRIAPSPTGLIHIGNLRTAIWNYLFAKKYNGKFILRIDDTDAARSNMKFVHEIKQMFKMLNMQYDEEFYQSQRSKRYSEVINDLLNKNLAYKCYLTDEELEDMKNFNMKNNIKRRSKWRDKVEHKIDESYVVRLRVDYMRKYVIDDLVQGQVQFLGQEIDDFIIARKDGTATYFLASAIDDIDYKITHIIRGDDHLTNTPKTLAIYSAMNIELPLFAHIPLVHDIHGRKMSKRNSNVAFVDYYKDYLASSIFHYLTLLGNGMNHGVQDEFSIDYSKFDLSKVGLAAARFDINKLQYYNKYYILHHSNLFAQLCERKIINDHMLQNNSKEILSKIIDLVKSRCTVLSDFNKYITMYLSDTKYNGFDDVNLVVVNNIDLICEIVSNNISDTKMIFKALKELAQENSIHVKFIMEGLRIIIAGVNESPSILEMIQFIGVDVFGKRIEHWKGIVNKL